MHDGPSRCRRGVLLGASALVLGALSGLALTPRAGAADPSEISVFLDGDLAIGFRRGVPPRRVDADTIRIRTADGRQARGQTIVGRFVFDEDTQRRAVVRPEAVREYYQLVKGLDVEAAGRKGERLLRKIQRTGKLNKLDEIDRGLRNLLGATYGAGTRLDDPGVTAAYPPALREGDPLTSYRHSIAGDDTLWRAYLEGNFDAFAELREAREGGRFHHAIDASTGAPAPDSMLRAREHRRVLIRRHRRTVLFLPDLPTREDVTDAGLEPGLTYALDVRRPLKGARHVLPALGERTRLLGGSATIVTRDAAPLFGGIDDRVGDLDAPSRPRVVNVTPPNGEPLVDATTDWEDPDNMFEVPLAARRTFTVRLRFAHPLDPRTVTATQFRLTKVAVAVGTENETQVFETVDVGVFLAQTRLGEVRVDVTPAQNLDPQSRYRVEVTGNVRSLSGELLGPDWVSVFETR